MSIRKILIANRGEIAVRIIRAARELGIHSIQVYSQADADSLAPNIADEAIEIGPPQARKSYLDMEAIIKAASQTGADAIHPGYGFLSENPDFADAVESAGFIFIGPNSATTRLIGDKVTARETAKHLGIPTVPGSAKRLPDDTKETKQIISDLGFPIMIKAAAGGGGRGIRTIEDMDEFDRLVPQAKAEASAAFGDGGLYAEKVITSSRHIEIQILGDGEHIIHCYERDCSLQRRRQKLWEEAPAAGLSKTARNKMCAAAVKLAEHINYCGAGTVEFLYDQSTNEFFFIEMNKRIQVEHPVTELVTGIDLIREMILIADGKRLRLNQDDVIPRGHAIEVRINAEDPSNDFMPFLGVVGNFTMPSGPGVRFDTFIYPGYTIQPFYDSLLGKLVVWDETREFAIMRLRRALGELQIGNIKTTKPLFESLVLDTNLNSAKFDTQWLEKWLKYNSGNWS